MKYFTEEQLSNKRIFIISLVSILSEIFIFNLKFFNEKIKHEIQKENKSDSEDGLKIVMFRIIINSIKELNRDCDFEELNSKKEFIKSKFQHDGNLAHLKKIYFSKFEDKEKMFAEISQKDFKRNEVDLELSSILTFCLEAITEHFLSLIQENLKDHNSSQFNNNDNNTNYGYFNGIDERIFIRKFVKDLIRKNEDNNEQISYNHSDHMNINNNRDNNFFNNQVSQSPLLGVNRDLNTNNENNFVYKTNLAKVNPNINLRAPNIKLNLFNNESKNETNGDLKQRSFKALKFDAEDNDPADIKEYNPMSLSASIVINDWLNNLIKNNEKKYNYKLKDDVLQYINEKEQVN